MRRALVYATAALAAGLMTHSYAQPLPGEVQEIIIKVVTDEGVKWYRLGEDLQPIDIKAGDRVEFDYADDTVEELESPPQIASEAGQNTGE